MTGSDDKLSDAERKARAMSRWANEGGAPAPEDPIGQEAPIATSGAGKPEGRRNRRHRMRVIRGDGRGEGLRAAGLTGRAVPGALE